MTEQEASNEKQQRDVNKRCLTIRPGRYNAHDPDRAAIEALHADKPRRRWLRRHGKTVEVYYTIQVPAHVPRNKLVTIAKLSDLREARRVMASLVDLGFDAIITYGDWKAR